MKLLVKKAETDIFGVFKKIFWKKANENDNLVVKEGMTKEIMTLLLGDCINDLKKQIAQFEIGVAEHPWRLKYRRKKGRISYYMVRGKTEVYLKRGDDRLEDAAKGTYYAELLKKANQDKKQLEACLMDLDNKDTISGLENVYESLSEPIRAFVKKATEICGVSDSFAKRWLVKKNRFRDRYYSGKENFVTSNGEYVRSKSELIIADRLHAAGVPYVYEADLYLDEGKTLLHPDFTVLNKRTGREYVWEHFGMIHNQEYWENAQSKINTYARNGYFIGVNLIVTLEGVNNPLYVQNIYKVIEQFLL